jgi:hypothetical protein
MLKGNSMETEFHFSLTGHKTLQSIIYTVNQIKTFTGKTVQMKSL